MLLLNVSWWIRAAKIGEKRAAYFLFKAEMEVFEPWPLGGRQEFLLKRRGQMMRVTIFEAKLSGNGVQSIRII